MKMLLVAIFALSCAQISNAATTASVKWFPPNYTTPPYPEGTTPQLTNTETPSNDWYLPDYTAPPYPEATTAAWTTPPFTNTETASNDWYLPDYTAPPYPEATTAAWTTPPFANTETPSNDWYLPDYTALPYPEATTAAWTTPQFTNTETPSNDWYLPDYTASPYPEATTAAWTTPPFTNTETPSNDWYLPDYTAPPYPEATTTAWTTPPFTHTETPSNDWYLPDYTAPPYPEGTTTTWTTPPFTNTETPSNDWYLPDYTAPPYPEATTAAWTTPPFTNTETPSNDWYLPDYTASPYPEATTAAWTTPQFTNTETPSNDWYLPDYTAFPYPEATTAAWTTPPFTNTETPSNDWYLPDYTAPPYPEATTTEWTTPQFTNTETPSNDWYLPDYTAPPYPEATTAAWTTPPFTNTETPSNDWYLPDYTAPPQTPLPTTKPTTLTPPTYPSDDYCPIREIKTCGTKYGTPAAKNQFSYVVFLKSTNAHKIQYCSGSLIHARWVLTSAYCMLPDSTVEVTLGALVPFDKEDPDRVVVQSEVVYVHPGYLPLHLNPKNDVALIKLSRPVALAAIIPIDLKWDSGLIPKDKVTFAGWGEVGYETLTYTRNITLVKGPCRCLDVKGQTVVYEDAAMDSEHFCGLSPEFFCFIHNGGGLVVDGVLVGVLSTRCFSHCRHREGIFTNIYNHLQWINDTIINKELGPKVHGACSDPSIIKSGVYLIQPNRGVQPFEVYCDVVNGKKWTVIQQRFSKEVDFYRNYANYTKGFGLLTGNHWLGLEKIHQLTKRGDHELLVLLQAHNLTRAYAKYSTFQVGPKKTGFKLTISGYSGNAGDSMYHTPSYKWNLNGMKFTTFDKDQDISRKNCAKFSQGGWWYNSCSASDVNGPYHDTPVVHEKTIHWSYNFGKTALKSVRMMVRGKRPS